MKDKFEELLRIHLKLFRFRVTTMLPTGVPIYHKIYFFLLFSEFPGDFAFVDAPEVQSTTQNVRKFQKSWLKKYPWIEYEDNLDAVFCKGCKEPRREKVYNCG